MSPLPRTVPSRLRRLAGAPDLDEFAWAGAPPIRTVIPVKRWYLLAVALSAVVLWHAWFSHFNHDEIEHLHAAWLVAQGQRPFVDFLEQHHPTLWYLLAPALGWFPSVRSLVFAVRLLDLACLGAVLLVFVRLLRRTYPGVPARWPLLLLVCSFNLVRCTLEIRPDPLMNALVYGGLLCWVAFLADGAAWRAAAAGLLLGAATAVLQKALVVVALVGGATVLLALRHRAEGARWRRLAAGAAALAAGAAVPVAALFAAMAASGLWQDFWFWNYRFNRFFYLQAALSKHFSIFVTLGASIAEAPVLWIAGCAGAVLCARELWRDRRRDDERAEARAALLLVAAGYLPFLCLNRFPLEQYFIVLLPLLALFSAEVVARLSSRRRRVWFERAAAFNVAILGGILLFYPANRREREIQDLVLSGTRPEQTVFVPPPYNPVFRRDGGYFWYNGALIANAYREYCRTQGECPGDKLALDDTRWASAPPRFVWLEDPEYYPARWSERSGGYQPTAVRHLYRASATAEREGGAGAEGISAGRVR